MRDFFLILSLALICLGVGCKAGLFACTVDAENNAENLLKACAKQHNVYECEIVAQPKKGQPE